MGRPRKKLIYVLVGDAVFCVDKERVLDLDSDPIESFGEEIQCPAADETLIALRHAFSWSFPGNPLIDGPAKTITEIRRVCVNALRDMPDVLEDMRLPTIPPFSEDEWHPTAKIATCYFARAADLRIRVTYEGKKRSLFNLLQPDPADALIRTARDVVTATFSEMHSRDQYHAVLVRIRNMIWDILPQFNEYLIPAEVEPMAPRDDDVEADT